MTNEEKCSIICSGIVTDLLPAMHHFDFLNGQWLLRFLLGNVPGYRSRSNREAGEERPDIILYPVNPANPAIIFELKVRKKFNEMADGLKEAIKQIKDMKYEEGILEEGYVGVKAYGVCFCRKNCVMAASC